MKNFLFLFVVYSLMASCSTKTDGSMPETRNITNEDFKEHRLEYEVLPIEMTDYVWTISVHDSIAYFFNMVGEELVSIYDLKNNRRAGSAIKIGEGPNELSGPGPRIQINGDKNFAAIFDGNQNTIMVFPLDVLTRVASSDNTSHAFTPFAKFNCETFNSDMIALDINTFVGLDHGIKTPEVSPRFTFYDRQGNVTAQKGEYYRTPEMKFPEEMNFFAFLGSLICSNDGEKVVLLNENTDRIELYDRQGDIIRFIIGPDHFAPDVIKITQGNMVERKLGKNGRRAFMFPVAKDGGFWAIYYGYITFDESIALRPEDKYTVILNYDWNGKPLNKYIIQADLRGFDIDENKGLLYGIILTEEGEQKIIKAKYK